MTAGRDLKSETILAKTCQVKFPVLLHERECPSLHCDESLN